MAKKPVTKTKKTSDCCDHQHPDYRGELPRLNRVAGQVAGVQVMINDRRYCPDILTQLRAIRAAIHAVEANILEAHLGACVAEAFNANNAKAKQTKIDELKALYRRFDG